MRRQRARTIRRGIESQCEVAYIQPMQPAENTLGEISNLPRAIKPGKLDAHRFCNRQQSIHPEFPPARDYRRISAAVEPRTDRDDRDASVINSHRMENISRRRVVEHRAQFYPVG